MNHIESKGEGYEQVYGSGLARVLAVLLFFVLLILASKIVQDVNTVFAPYAVNSIKDTNEYKKLADQHADLGHDSPDYIRLQQEFSARHEADETKSLIITSSITVLMWILALLLHFSFGIHKRQYLVLSIPYYIVSAFLLVYLLLNIGSLLFEKSVTLGLYVALLLVIIVLTLSVILYLKKQNKIAAE